MDCRPALTGRFFHFYIQKRRKKGESRADRPRSFGGETGSFFGGGEQKNDKAQQQQQRLLIPNDYENEINGYCSRLQYIILFFEKKRASAGVSGARVRKLFFSKDEDE
jgi:hypothetical protein